MSVSCRQQFLRCTRSEAHNRDRDILSSGLYFFLMLLLGMLIGLLILKEAKKVPPAKVAGFRT